MYLICDTQYMGWVHRSQSLTFQNRLGELLIHSPTLPLCLSKAASSSASWGWISEARPEARLATLLLTCLVPGARGSLAASGSLAEQRPHLHMQGPKLDSGWTWDSASPFMAEDRTKQGTGNDGKCRGPTWEGI